MIARAYWLVAEPLFFWSDVWMLGEPDPKVPEIKPRSSLAAVPGRFVWKASQTRHDSNGIG